MSKIVRRSAREREHLLAGYRASKQTQEAFARAHDLNVGTLRGWLYRGEAGCPSRPAFVEVVPSALPSVVIELGAGVRVAFSVAPPAHYLAELAQALVC